MKKLVKLFITLFILCLIPTTVLASDVHRLYNRGTGEHLYTTDVFEKDTLSNGGWRYEGIGWVSADEGESVYRLYSPITHEHLYTKDQHETTVLQNNGWQLDNNGNALFYSNGTIPIYRLYHEGIKLHLLSTDATEYNHLKSNGWNDEGVALYAQGEGTPLPPEESDSNFEPGKRTVKNFLLASLLPMGETNYIWGGGWNEADDGAGPGAMHIGVMPEWKAFFDRQNASYDYNTTRYQINNGLDCSGFVGWAVYNTLNTTDNNLPGEVLGANRQARWYASKGYGSVQPLSDNRDTTNYKPGDIISMASGHVYIVLGTCSDGSIVVCHSSPPGVMITGLTFTKGGDSQARQLAHQYMQKYRPEYYRRYSNRMDREMDDYLHNIERFRWGDNFVGDPDGIRNLSAEQVLHNIFGED